MIVRMLNVDGQPLVEVSYTYGMRLIEQKEAVLVEGEEPTPTPTPVDPIYSRFEANEAAISANTAAVADMEARLATVEGSTVMAAPPIREARYGNSVSIEAEMEKQHRRDMKIAVMPKNLFDPYHGGKTGMENCLATTNGVGVVYLSGEYIVNGTATAATAFPRNASGGDTKLNKADAMLFGTLLPAGNYVTAPFTAEMTAAGVTLQLSAIETVEGLHLFQPYQMIRGAQAFTIGQDAVVFLRFAVPNGATVNDLHIRLGIYRADNVPESWESGDLGSVNVTAGNKTATVAVSGCTWLEAAHITALFGDGTTNTVAVSASAGGAAVPVLASWIAETRAWIEARLAEMAALLVAESVSVQNAGNGMTINNAT